MNQMVFSFKLEKESDIANMTGIQKDIRTMLNIYQTVECFYGSNQVFDEPGQLELDLNGVCL